LPKRFDPKDQGQRREMAGSSSIEMTFDEIAGSNFREDDPRAVFGPSRGSIPDGMALNDLFCAWNILHVWQVETLSTQLRMNS
jgi:hypothetical protein